MNKGFYWPLKRKGLLSSELLSMKSWIKPCSRLERFKMQEYVFQTDKDVTWFRLGNLKICHHYARAFPVEGPYTLGSDSTMFCPHLLSTYRNCINDLLPPYFKQMLETLSLWDMRLLSFQKCEVYLNLLCLDHFFGMPWLIRRSFTRVNIHELWREAQVFILYVYPLCTFSYNIL